jgi:hypothetical protein
LVEAGRVLELRVEDDDQQGVAGHPERVAEQRPPPQPEIEQRDLSVHG